MPVSEVVKRAYILCSVECPRCHAAMVNDNHTSHCVNDYCPEYRVEYVRPSLELVKPMIILTGKEHLVPTVTEEGIELLPVQDNHSFVLGDKYTFGPGLGFDPSKTYTLTANGFEQDDAVADQGGKA